LERQRTSLGVSVTFSPTPAATGIPATQPTSGQPQSGQTLATPSPVRHSISATQPLVVERQVGPVLDVNMYLLPTTSNNHSDLLPQTAETKTTAGFGGPSLTTNTTTVSANRASLMSATANSVSAYGATLPSTSALVITPSTYQSQTLAVSIVDLLPPPSGASSSMQTSTTSASQPVPAATPSQLQTTYTPASVPVGSSTASTSSSSQTAPTQSSAIATAATAATAAPIVVVRQQQQVKLYAGHSSWKNY